MKQDTLFAMLYLGKLSRDVVNYSNTPKGREPDHSWSTFGKLREAFLKKHPDHKDSLKRFMKSEADYWGSLFSDLFQTQSLYIYVANNIL